MYIRYINVDYEWVSMRHFTVWLIKINTFNLETPFANWCATNLHASESSPSLIPVSMSEWITFVPSGRYLIGMGANRRLKCLLSSYCTNKDSFHNFLLGPFHPSSIFFGVGGFFGRRTSRCENTDLTWLNMD